jgi:hypothetical protein
MVQVEGEVRQVRRAP